MSKRLSSFVCFVMILGIVAGPAVLADIIIPPIESCRTDIREPGENKHDSSKLSVRSDEKSAKSWIKFDISELEVGDIETAILAVTLHHGQRVQYRGGTVRCQGVRAVGVEA